MRYRSWLQGLGATVLVVAAVAVAGCSADEPTRPSASSTGITQLGTAPGSASSSLDNQTNPGSSTSGSAAPAPVRIMALGDSITAGGDPAQPATSPQSYRGYLGTSLQAAGYQVDFVGSEKAVAIGGTDPDHEGHGGYTIGPDNSKLCPNCPPANIDASLQGWLDAAQPDIVVLLIGVNDLLPESNPNGVVRETVPTQAGAKLTALVRRIRSLRPQTTVVVASYPPITFLVDPALTGRVAFGLLNDAAKALGAGADDRIVYAPLRETLDTGWTQEDVLSASGDQLHPSAAGAKKMAAVFHEALVPVLDALK